MTEPLLRVDALRKVFGEHVAVDDVSFDLDEGGSLAIVGESGSGKTTVARMLVGLERPTAGAILFAGRNRSQPAGSRAERLARAHEVQLASRTRTPASTGARPSRSASTSPCASTSPAPPHRCAGRGSRRWPRWSAWTTASSGRYPGRSRAASASAWPSPGCWPPTRGSSSSTRPWPRSTCRSQAQVLNLLADIREQTGVSYILISHDLAVVRQLTDHILVMHHGRVVERGETGPVLDAPQEPYTHLLRDSVPRPGWRPRRRQVPAQPV